MSVLFKLNIAAAVFSVSLSLQADIVDFSMLDMDGEHRQRWQVPSHQWHPKLQQLSMLESQQAYAEADALIQQWLATEHEQALQYLPSTAYYIEYLADDDRFIPVYVAYLLNRYVPAQALYQLSLLNLENKSVELAAKGVMSHWWNNDQSGMVEWWRDNPGFYPLLVRQFIRETVIIEQQSIPVLLSVIDAWHPETDGLLSIYNSAFSAFEQPSIHVFVLLAQRYVQLLGEEDIRTQQASKFLSYLLYDQGEYTQTLAWLDLLRAGNLPAFEHNLLHFSHNLPPADVRARALLQDYVDQLPKGLLSHDTQTALDTWRREASL